MTTDTKAIRAQMEALAGFTAGPWYTHNQPGDWGLGGAHSIHVADANPYQWDQCIAHVEYQTPYCLGEKPSVVEAARTADCNARLIAAAPAMHATILTLCGKVDRLRAENERLMEALALIGVMGYSKDPAVNANIARMAVTQAREARALAQEGGE